MRPNPQENFIFCEVNPIPIKKKQILILENSEYINQYNDTTIFDVNSQENTTY